MTLLSSSWDGFGLSQDFFFHNMTMREMTRQSPDQWALLEPQLPPHTLTSI